MVEKIYSVDFSPQTGRTIIIFHCLPGEIPPQLETKLFHLGGTAFVDANNNNCNYEFYSHDNVIKARTYLRYQGWQHSRLKPKHPKPKSIPFSGYEDEIILKYYPSGGSSEVRRFLPERYASSISKRAVRLGIRYCGPHKGGAFSNKKAVE